MTCSANSSTKGYKAVTDFRIVKQYINNAVKAKKIAVISKRLQEFAAQPSLTPDHLNIESAKVAAEARKLLRSVDGLYAQINEIDVDEYFGEKAMWDRLESLAQLIRQKLEPWGGGKPNEASLGSRDGDRCKTIQAMDRSLWLLSRGNYQRHH